MGGGSTKGNWLGLLSFAFFFKANSKARQNDLGRNYGNPRRETFFLWFAATYCAWLGACVRIKPSLLLQLFKWLKFKKICFCNNKNCQLPFWRTCLFIITCIAWYHEWFCQFSVQSFIFVSSIGTIYLQICWMDLIRCHIRNLQTCGLLAYGMQGLCTVYMTDS